MQKYSNAILSGIFGSMAGFFGKLTFQEEHTYLNYELSTEISYLIRIPLLILMLLANKWMF